MFRASAPQRCPTKTTGEGRLSVTLASARPFARQAQGVSGSLFQRCHEGNLSPVEMKPYYEQDGITIYHGDCREILPTLSAVDVVLTDPPYEAEAHTMQRRVKRTQGVNVETLPFPSISEPLRQFVAAECGRLAQRWVLTFCQIEAAPRWREVYEEAGLNYRRTCIWVKPDGMPQYSGDRPGMGYETFVAMHTNGKSRWNGGGRHGVFIVNKNNGKGPALHPTQKPLGLMNQLVNLFSDKGEIILDPFMGSGTTARAAKNCGRQFIGIELEEKYCEIAVKRLAQGVLNF